MSFLKEGVIMKLKNLFISLKIGAVCVLRLKCSDSMFLDFDFVIDDEEFLWEIQEIFGDLLISRVDVLKNVYFTILLDSDLFLEFKNYLVKGCF